VVGTLAIGTGFAIASLALIVFGAVGYVDLVGSVALVHHFRHAAHHELSDRFERRAHRIVTAGLLAVGVASVVVSIGRLVARETSEVSAFAVVLAGVSMVALAILALAKVVIAARVPSGALRSDGHVSAIGATQAAVVLAGSLLTADTSITWADNAAAMIVGAVAIVLAIATWREIPDAPAA